MLVLEKPKMILLEAESIIKSVIVSEEPVTQIIEKHMQEEPFYGEPDYSYY